MVDLRLLDEASTAPLARSPACLEPELLGVLNKMLFVCGSEASSEVWSRLGPHTFCSRARSQYKKNLYCGTCVGTVGQGEEEGAVHAACRANERNTAWHVKLLLLLAVTTASFHTA